MNEFPIKPPLGAVGLQLPIFLMGGGYNENFRGAIKKLCPNFIGLFGGGRL